MSRYRVCLATQGETLTNIWASAHHPAIQGWTCGEENIFQRKFHGKFEASHMEDSEVVTASADECICENSFLGEGGLVNLFGDKA